MEYDILKSKYVTKRCKDEMRNDSNWCFYMQEVARKLERYNAILKRLGFPSMKLDYNDYRMGFEVLIGRKPYNDVVSGTVASIQANLESVFANFIEVNLLEK